MSDDPHIDPRELAEAEALAEALDGGEGPADAEALEAAALLGAQGRFELDADRFAAVRDRIAGELPEAPRRRWRWLLIAAPALAAAVVAVVMLPTGSPPEPSTGVQPTRHMVQPDVQHERARAPREPRRLGPPDALVEAQRGVIEGKADRLPVYQRLLDQYRRDLLRAAKTPEPGSTIAHLVVAFAWAGEGEDQKALRQDLARRIAQWYVARHDLHGARRWIDRGLAIGGPPTVFTAALHIERWHLGFVDTADDYYRAAEINGALRGR